MRLNCGKIDDFSDLLTCKDLARLTINSSETLNLSALWEFKELGFLDICQCPHIEDFSVFSKIKNSLRLLITREQFFKAYKYLDKTKIKVQDFRSEEDTPEQQAIFKEWFGE